MKDNPFVQRTVAAQASLLKRLIAFIIDLFILNFIVFYPFQSYVRGLVPNKGIQETISFFSEHQGVSNLLFLLTMAMGFLAFVYFYVLEKKFQQSIGKMITKIYIAADDKEVKAWQVVVRNLFLFPIFPFILLWLLDPIIMVINKQNKRLSEILSKTKVVEDIPY